MQRRKFIKNFSLGLAALGTTLKARKATAADVVTDIDERRDLGFEARSEATFRSYDNLRETFPNNGDEERFSFVASFTKGLRHDSTTGEVNVADYRRYLQALRNSDFGILDNLQIGPRGLANPQAGISLVGNGSDSHKFRMQTAPSIIDAENSAEMVELYWQALCRDINFLDYDTDPTIAQAAADLNNLSAFMGPDNGQVTSNNIFRGNLAKDTVGPYISQFLLRDIPTGSFLIPQKQRQFSPGIDFMTNFNDWLFIQDGNKFGDDQAFDGTDRYIRNGRDLASYVREDEIYQAYYNTALILLDADTLFDVGNPFNTVTGSQGGVTFGRAHLLSLISDVAYAALKAVWFQKWFVHRRLRPEEFGGRIHQHLSGVVNYDMINDEVLNSDALNATFSKFGSYFLPQAYDVGSPTHPAYGAGHAAIAGACGTVLKAFFDQDLPINNPVQSSADGLSLEPYTGSDAGQMTIGSEIDKLVGNISIGRDWGGIHWRTDYTRSIRLGERVAMQLLRQQNNLQIQRHSFSFTRFNGKNVRIRGNGF